MSEPSSPAKALFFYEGWETFQNVLCAALAPLTDEQLHLRTAPNLRSVGDNLRHIIGARARWFYMLMGIGGELFANLSEWDRPNQPERSASALIDGLQQSWGVIRATLTEWTADDLTYTYPNEDREPGEPETFSRQWVIWHLIEHDIYHGGEISQILGANGLKGVDL
jgi:uncharacterized damage-inducible protein DinB